MKQFSLRLPDKLHEELERSATDNRRSLNSEILARLQGEGPMREVLENVAMNSGVMIRWLQEGSFRAIPEVIKFLETARGFALAAMDKDPKGGE